METTGVIIVGAGPSGLALALSLAKFGIKSIVLEKEMEITEDPRGVFITHEAVRILWDLGIGADMKIIGHDVETLGFHNTSFQNEPFYVMDPRSDFAQQTVQNGIFQIQPRLEASLRRRLGESEHCELRSGCEVIGRDQSDESVVVTYKTHDGTTRSIKASWLVGADGKRGVVRKHFLEKSGIQQVEGAYKYEGTWIASNLKIHLPTPETHPGFPLWALGYTPEQVYDLYWPRGFHFCSPPGKPTASGRFGPHEERLWRHEFAQHDYNETMNCQELLWEHIGPMITRSGDAEKARVFPCGPLMYPRDCVTIMRCRPFRFAHKMVNKWFDGRTLLIGDAAHVFPPFGGQGIACGVGDAHQLAWRLLLLNQRPDADRVLSDKVLTTWASERRQGVKDAAEMTRFNGQLCNVGDSWGFWFFRNLAWLSRLIPFVPTIAHPFTVAEKRGFGKVEDSFFLADFNGGPRVAQIACQSGQRSVMLSDQLLRINPTIITLLVIDDNAESITKHVHDAKVALNHAGLDGPIISEDSIRVFSPSGPVDAGNIEVFYPTTPDGIADLPVKANYRSSTYAERFAPTTKYVLVRNDVYIFAQARDQEELDICLAGLRQRVL